MTCRLVMLCLCLATYASAGTDDKIPARQETVVVTGAFEPVPLEEADRAINVFDIRDTAILFGNWTNYVRLDPSLDLRQRAPNGVQADLSIRGASFGQTLVLVNGLRVNDAQSGHHNLDVPFGIGSLERIEVLRGTGSTLYGSDAVGGVVNFIASPPPVSEFRLGVAVGNFGINQQQGSAAYATKRWSQLLAFDRDFSSGFQPDRDYRSSALVSDTRVSTSLGNSSLLLAYSDRPFGADQFYGPFNSWERTKTWFASVAQELGARTQLALAYRRHTDLFVLYRDRPQVFTNDHATESWQLALRRRQPLARNVSLFYGGEGYRDSIDSTNLGQHARNRGAGYLDLDVRALRRFSFSIGAREDVYGNMRGQFSPSVSGGMWVAPSLKLRAAVSRAFRLPSYTDLYYHDPANSGSLDLRPESAWGYEGGLDWTRGKLRNTVAIFHRRERDGIDYVRRSPNDIWRASNIQRLSFTGVEASMRIAVNRAQQIDLAYTGLHGAQESLGNLSSKYIFNYPIHNGSIAWQGTLPGKLLGRTRMGVTERRARDAYLLWDMAVARKFGPMSPYVQVSNITDTAYEEIRGVPMPGRSVVLGLQITIAGAPKH